MELSLADQGISFSTCSEAIQSFVTENKKRPDTLTLTKNHAVGVDGITNLAEQWLATSNDESETPITTLNVASCSLGRCVNPSTGANILSSTGVSALGKHGDRLKNVDLSWNDLNTEAIDAFVRGLLDIKGPAFDAESYDPLTLIPSRTCALESINLTGNSICDEGLEAISHLVIDPSETLKIPSNLKSIILNQCALQGNGGEILCRMLNHESSQIISLNCFENDVTTWSLELAKSVIKNEKLIEFNNINLIELKNKLSNKEENINIIAGKNTMNHGVLSILLTLRPFVFPDEASIPNPISTDTSAADAEAATTEKTDGVKGSVTLDLRESFMCGFYQEEEESVNELISLLQHINNDSSSDSSNNKSPEITSSKEGDAHDQSPVILNPSLIYIKTIELDDDSGLTSKQIKALYDACGPSNQKTRTVLKVNGTEYKPASSCVIC
mmetsp:Transcript_40194/g.51774  ORF Transcript_40194/g.51774 Transcript_40194/m.51774 type:complete len:443 (-) Transcript_40194:305-1633(-)|eukprot:CAMPEP_0114342928 /NCGR_PEP_ID=MMETSP0101-20121206/10189_1 /TAXON_ID=38822 ORGANISM="Pteridomonas danica, Strain PT" /NCGR_SAMPLE_ID=MMETSP0101 /ASSEMBLY_ACC=CAM_ASM_000211 /LENGTH=442 /DNA_ID=CAMNT_0001477325 /DNA_START=202 /DNA_END=1530 /DNA_ORIENTATION=+